MDREDALSRLPETYETALRLRDAGLDDAGVAARLKIPLEAVGPLLRLAEAKLARLLAASEHATREPCVGAKDLVRAERAGRVP